MIPTHTSATDCLVKTEKLAEQHFKRVSNFAKEMLVWPDEINVHKTENH